MTNKIQTADRWARVLAFHSISEPQSLLERRFYTTPHRLRRILTYLQRSGYYFECVSALGSERLDSKSVILTFDDGYDDFFTQVLPMVPLYDFRPMLFVVAGLLGQTNQWDKAGGHRSRRLMSADEVREAHLRGAIIGSHSLTHAWLPGLSDRALKSELFGSKQKLEDLLGSRVDTFAYPFGAFDTRVRDAVEEAGYVHAFTAEPARKSANDPLLINRVELSQAVSWPLTIANIRMRTDLRRNLRSFYTAPLRRCLRALPASLATQIRTRNRKKPYYVSGGT